MLKKLLLTWLTVCLFATVPVAASAAEKPIQLYVNNEKMGPLDAFIEKGIMYVALRQFLTALGYEVHYDEGRVYLSIRDLCDIMKYAVNYDQKQRTVSMMKYGYGQEPAIRELITKFYKTGSPTLLSDDNPQRGYYNLDFDYVADANRNISEIPVKDFSVNIDRLDFTSEFEATLQVTITDNDEVINKTSILSCDLRNVNGQWKIAHYDWKELLTELPSDINESAAAIMNHQYEEQLAVLSDLRTYNKAYNEENLEQTLQYTAPSFMEHWQAAVIGGYAWSYFLEAYFAFSDTRENLSGERVVFLGEKEAVVHATKEWSETVEGITEGPYEYEVLIYMDYANGHWNYHTDFTIGD